MQWCHMKSISFPSFSPLCSADDSTGIDFHECWCKGFLTTWAQHPIYERQNCISFKNTDKAQEKFTEMGCNKGYSCFQAEPTTKLFVTWFRPILVFIHFHLGIYLHQHTISLWDKLSTGHLQKMLWQIIDRNNLCTATYHSTSHCNSPT